MERPRDASIDGATDQSSAGGPSSGASASQTAQAEPRKAGRGLIEVKDVTRRFGSVVAIEGVSLRIEPHSSVALVGPSGCGKSTLLSMIAGLDESDAGVVSIDDATTAPGRLKHCALMPQNDLLLPWRTALDNACLALDNQGVPKKEARERAKPLFERFGLASFENRRPGQLSGGMRQRVAFLRTLLAGKDVLLLDEPFGALDALTRAQAQEWLLSALQADPRTTVLVTHDVEEALLLADHLVVLSNRPGRIVLESKVDIDRTASRREIITSRAFVELKEAALESLE